jgi:hypothetical protein
VKYIYYILAIVLLLSAVIGFELVPNRVPEGKAALRVNRRIITLDEFNQLYSSFPLYAKNRGDFTNSLITRELLVQEARNEGIDKDERFRRSIENYYEQSLIKLLMDRKFASLHVVVTDEEVDRYIRLLNKKVSLTIFSTDGVAEIGKDRFRSVEHRTALFDDLSEDVRDAVAGLKEGEMSGPIKMAKGFVVIRLDTIGNSSLQSSPSDRETVRRRLTEAKKEKMISDWVAGLRNKASVKIYLDTQKQGKP